MTKEHGQLNGIILLLQANLTIGCNIRLDDMTVQRHETQTFMSSCFMQSHIVSTPGPFVWDCIKYCTEINLVPNTRTFIYQAL